MSDVVGSNGTAARVGVVGVGGVGGVVLVVPRVAAVEEGVEGGANLDQLRVVLVPPPPPGLPLLFKQKASTEGFEAS